MMVNSNLLCGVFDCRNWDRVCCWGSGALKFCNAVCRRALKV